MRTWPWAWTGATLAARLLLGIVFALSALTKITAPGIFRSGVASYGLLPPALVGPFAAALPWIEALVALYLFAGLFLRVTAVVTALLLVMFTGALAISLVHGNTGHSCGCLPTSGPLGSLPLVTWLAGGATITPFDVVRDLIFILLAAVIFRGDRATLSLDGLLFKPAPIDDGDDADEEADDTFAPLPHTTVATRSAGRNV